MSYFQVNVLGEGLDEGCLHQSVYFVQLIICGWSSVAFRGAQFAPVEG